MLGLSKKLQHSLTLAVVFFVLSSPLTYRLIDKLVGGVVTGLVPQLEPVFKVAQAGCPTTYGLALHSLAFFLVSYYLLHSL
jgi:hypothetical protein